eukprot:CAMPEP_0197409442 /NCGR_PEP_ID=MMETSP1165-20131217/29913_1 /TAXON_ID=284809 /ORGANISM="Chrysocystis fragilis, Strain CCMP3189" /LENGTH=61 /DNA_ID=CAMNT_0042935903 /DNA_START=216 /DNA_END=401 /DNA_ORIENTATION=-
MNCDQDNGCREQRTALRTKLFKHNYRHNPRFLMSQPRPSTDIFLRPDLLDLSRYMIPTNEL